MAKDRGRRAEQIKTAYQLAGRDDPRLPLYIAGPAILALGVLLAIGFVLGHPIYFGVLGVLVAAAVAAIVFGRRASASAFRQVEGQPGAAAAVLQGMRGNWRVTPAVALTRGQDFVHLAVGRPGVVLVAEGSPARAGQLLGQEKRRIGRVIGDTPIYDVTIGDGEGQVPLRALQRHFMRLPRNLKPAQVNAVQARIKAIGSAGPPLPKGPMPRGTKLPRGKMR